MNKIITIAREYGSGGREIGEKLAEKLGIQCYDEKILDLASKESGLTPQMFQSQEENRSSGFLSSLLVHGATVCARGGLGGGNVELSINDEAFFAIFETMENLAKKGPCVIVGRCADYALRTYDNVVNIFIRGEEEDKIRRICSRTGLDEKQALARMIEYDKRRASHYKYYTDRKGNQTNYYDLSLNSSLVGIDGCVEIILQCLKLAEEK